MAPTIAGAMVVPVLVRMLRLPGRLTQTWALGSVLIAISWGVERPARHGTIDPTPLLGVPAGAGAGGGRWDGGRSRPVSRILCPAAEYRPPGGGHLSTSRVAATLVQPTREHRTGRPLPAWPCSGWGLPSRPVTRPLVSSYLTVAPLPRRGGLFSVALSAGRPAWALPSTLPCGVRTFLDPVTRAAAARPAPPGPAYGRPWV